MKTIRELDFRYPSNSQTSATEREAKILLLASDVADVPPHLLAKAAEQWARTSVYMPKASELIQLAHDALPRRGGGTKTYADWVLERNQHLQDTGNQRGIHWIMEGTETPGGTGMHLEFLSAHG